MMSQSRQRVPLRSDFEKPPIADTQEGRIQNAMEYCGPPRNWSLNKSAAKSDISVGVLRE